VSDGWAAYANIEAIHGGIYTHAVVVHQAHFVDLNDSDIHTQNIENMWMRAKRKLKRQFGTSRELFTQGRRQRGCMEVTHPPLSADVGSLLGTVELVCECLVGGVSSEHYALL